LGLFGQRQPEGAGARDVQAVQVGGPSGACIGPDEFNRVLAYEDLATGGSFIVVGKHRDLLKDVVLNFARFFREESCGSCVPCRALTGMAQVVLERIVAGKGTAEDVERLQAWQKIMRNNRCGLGQTALTPIVTTIQNFPAAVRRAAGAGRSALRPSFDLAARSKTTTAGRRERVGEARDGQLRPVHARRQDLPGGGRRAAGRGGARGGSLHPDAVQLSGIPPRGRVRICTVLVNGIPQTACTTKVAEDMNVATSTPELEAFRKSVVEILFAEGNHLCPSCERSGNCELQALAYRYRVTVSNFPYLFPKRDVEAWHPKLVKDHNRCIQCKRCIRGIHNAEWPRPLRLRQARRQGRHQHRSGHLEGHRRRAGAAGDGHLSRGRDPAQGQGLRRAHRAAHLRPGAHRQRGAAVSAKAPKKIVATTSLAGCFGCHMSLLDIDERILDLIELVEFNKSPLDDIKTFTKECDVGLIEGGCCNDENVHVLTEFRKHCKTLVAFGECALMGGLPALRNVLPLKECLDEAYLNGPTVADANPRKIIPHDPDIPKILNRVYPCHEVVKIDYFLPGCPPSADLIWDALVALVTGKELDLPYLSFKFD
jgi:[NiFe] hydrogenase diaphorase moiety small subunit